MKYLIIAALVSFVLAVIYLRVRPYLKLIRKVTESLNSATDVSATKATPSSNRLVRCERCGTWVPADRALKLKSGLATFCSMECMAKEPASKGRKMA